MPNALRCVHPRRICRTARPSDAAHLAPMRNALPCATEVTRDRGHGSSHIPRPRLHETPPLNDVRREFNSAAYADECFGESKAARAGLAWPIPDHALTSNVNSARAQVGMWVILLEKRQARSVNPGL